MKKKLISALLIASMLMTTLIGCGASTTDVEETTNGEKIEEEVPDEKQTEVEVGKTTIHFWNAYTGSDGDILREFVKEFNETNEDGIVVEMDIMPGDTFNQKLPQAISTNTAPDVVLWGYDALGSYVEEGAFASVDDYWEKGNVPKDDFYPSVLELYNVDGVQYEIPFVAFGASYYYWNKDLFKAAGLDPEKPATTWDEVAEYARKITDASRNIYGIGVHSGDYQMTHAMIVGKGYGWYDEETNTSDLAEPAVMDVFKTVQNMVQVDKSSPMNVTGNEFDTLFANGQIGQYLNGPWLLNALRQSGVNFGVAVVPDGPVSLGSTGFAIPQNISEENKLAVYKFIDYMMSTEKVTEWSLRNGFPPVRMSVAESDEIKQDSILQVYAQGLETAVPRYVGATKVSTIVSEVIGPLCEQVYFGNADVEESCKKAAEQMNELLKE